MRQQLQLGSIMLLALTLSACPIVPAAPPPWALGEQPNFSGSIEDWAKGDAIAPGDSSIFGTMYGTGGPEGVDIGYGGIKADASFTFGLQRGAAYAGGGIAAAQLLCADVKLSNPQQRIARIDVLAVPSLYVDGQHARVGGGIFISLGQPVLSGPSNRYVFYYADSDGRVQGSCPVEGVGRVPFDLELSKGWNSVRRTITGFQTAVIPKEARWYFINTLTVTP